MRARTLPLLIAAAVGLPACGTGVDPAAAGDGQAAREAAQIKFARCMREHGVDLPEKPDTRGASVVRIGKELSPGKIKAATQACDSFRRAAMPKLTAAQRQEMQDAFVEFAACMREHGVEVPTPRFDSGGGPDVVQAPDSGEKPPSPDDPKVKAANDACKDKLPKGGMITVGSGPR